MIAYKKYLKNPLLLLMSWGDEWWKIMI
jgi:hypothetical protein